MYQSRQKIPGIRELVINFRSVLTETAISLCHLCVISVSVSSLCYLCVCVISVSVSSSLSISVHIHAYAPVLTFSHSLFIVERYSEPVKN